jgi:hypothetical protein
MDHPLDVAVSGSTLLHIIGDDPGGFEVHLEELITRLLRGRSPMELAERTERFLVRHVGTLTYISRDEVRELVDQLAASKSSARRAAAIKLQRMGTRVVPHLQRHLRREGLEPEQIARIQVLLKSFPLIDEDTPSSLACLLSADQSHWRILAARMNAPQREAANEHLRRCGLETLRR